MGLLRFCPYALLQFIKICFGIITWNIWLCYIQPTQITRSVIINLRGKIAMQTSKGIVIPRTEFKAIGASLGSKIRLDKYNPLAFSFSLVLDGALELIETPRVKPSIKSLAHEFIPTFSYSFKVFHNNRISVADNLLAYNMVVVPHKAFLSARQGFKPSLSGFCAFALQPFTQIIKLNNLGFWSFENNSLACYSEVIYSDINTQNSVATTRSWSVDVSGKSDVEEQSAFSILDYLKSLVSPIKIFPIVFGNIYRYILHLSWDKSRQSNLIKRELKQLTIEANRTGLNNRLLFKFDRFKVFRSFCYGFTGKVSRKPFSQIFINKMMKFKPIAYFGFKSLINSILDSLKKSIAHINQFLIMLNFQLYGSDRFHIIKCRHRLYINLMPKCPVEVSLASLP